MIETVATGRLPSDEFPRASHFFELLFRKASQVPEHVALVYEKKHISYRELLDHVASVARQLQEAGVKAGDKVGMLFPNHPDYVAGFFAAAGLGATIVPINPLLKADEIAHILIDSESSTLIVHQDSLAEALKSQSALSGLKRIFVGGAEAESDDALVCGGSTQLIARLSRGRAACSEVIWHRDFDVDNDLALIVYTSGTTGKPKGAMLTHRSMLSIFPARFDLFDVTENDRTLATLPMCHIYGIAILMIGTLSRGARLVMVSRFEAAPVLKLVQDEKVTLLPAVPAMYQFMLLELDKNDYDLSSVRICFSGAAPLAPELIETVEEKFGAVLIEGFGMTETSCVATINPLKGPRKPGSVGPALPGVQISVLSESGDELPPGPEYVGELCIRGPNLMLGYYRQEKASLDSLRPGGWFASGDLCYRDEDGYIYIVGRKKEMIIRGGANIYPREIEDVLLKMEAVLEAAVVGVPDKFMGERVKAVVVLKKGFELSEEELKRFCAEHLAEYKVPRLVDFRQALPRNSTGKVLKRLLVEGG